ncbi:MAG: serine/threonine protein kinase [Planctomycetes bacterium]|nr:serine/threonine protein kinase [Planctomycetota bacterium]
MSSPDTDRDPLEALAAEFAERLRNGELPSVTEYALQHPDLADDIRDLFPTILAMERLKARGERSSDGLASLGPVTLERLGDFRIVREIGRGGMGIVYEAEQESLGRRVALKVMPRQALLDGRHLTRFKREARVAAALHHTNIVQVYGVGQQDGFHYYAMQFVRGVGLDQVIRRLAATDDVTAHTADSWSVASADADHTRLVEEVCRHLTRHPSEGKTAERVAATIDSSAEPMCLAASYFRVVAEIGMQAADALDYAHGQGTLHRDIKPANLLIDETGRVWITDFGLARALDSENVTQPGDVSGTLRYVPPERFSGRVDAQGDIYALGLTLYELLTLRAAFEDTDRQKLIHRLIHDTPPPPRRFNPRIPRDLETIVLKAMAHEPQRRYASAASLAADLRRFLEDRPIEARRTGPIERLWRWSRRNRTTAALAALAALLLVTTAVTATIGYLNTRSALEGEALQRQKAESVSSVAQEALDRIFDRLGPARALDVPGLTVEGDTQTTIEGPSYPILSKESAALLEEMLPYYDRLAEQSGGETSLHLRAAEATRRVGDIRERLGQYEQALAAYRRAIALYVALGWQPGQQALCNLRIAHIQNALGRLYRSTGQFEDAQQFHQRALALLESAESPTAASDPDATYELARTWYFLATKIPDRFMIKPLSMDAPPALPPLSDWEFGDDFPMPPPRGRDMLPPDDSVARKPHRPRDEGAIPKLPQPPDADERRTYIEKSIGLLRQLEATYPDNPEYRRLLALCYRDGARAFSRGDRTTGETYTEQAVEILEALVRDYPGDPDFRIDLCMTYAAADVDGPFVDDEKLRIAESRLRKAEAIAEELVAGRPDIAEYLVSLANVQLRLAAVLAKTDRLEEAEQYARKAIATLERVVSHVPDVASHQVWLAAFRNLLADLLVLRGQFDASLSLVSQSIDAAEKLLAAHEDMTYIHAVLADGYRILAAAHRGNGQADLAAKASDQADSHWRQLPRLPKPPRHQP